ncbi:MAG: 30S ribosomal protein S20, partial [Ignavibacteriaceae bacterium]
MANHKSAEKRIRTSAKRRLVNKNIDSKIKTIIKKTFGSSEKEEAEKLYKEAVGFLDRSTTKGKIHRNTAARKKAALTKH